VELWEEIQQLRARVKEVEQRFAVLEAKVKEPPKTSQNSSVPPWQTWKGDRPEGKPKGMRREASVGRAGGGRELHPNPDQRVTAVAKVCPHCGVAVEECDQKVQSVYDKIELPLVKPMVTRVTQYGGQCGQCGQSYVAPVPVGLEGRSPFGTSVASLATYFRYTHAISYERLVGLFWAVFHLKISEGLWRTCWSASRGNLRAPQPRFWSGCAGRVWCVVMKPVPEWTGEISGNGCFKMMRSVCM
jgi:transposase